MPTTAVDSSLVRLDAMVPGTLKEALRCAAFAHGNTLAEELRIAMAAHIEALAFEHEAEQAWREAQVLA